VMQFYPYLQRIVWLGGEVFLYKGFQELFEEGAKHPRMTQQITTNGVILTEEWIERIMNVPNVELTISVDGATREVYEYIRKGAKFDDLTGKIRRINELREKRRWPGTLRINTVVMKSNYRQLDSFVEFADEHGFDRLSLMAVQNDGDPAEAIFDGRGDAEALSFITEAIPRLRATAKAKGLDLDVLLPTNERSFEKIESAQAALPPEQRTVYCKYPWKILQLAGHGKAELTGSCLKSIGNYHEKSLWEIWNSPVAQDYRKAMLASTFRGFCRPECMSRWDL
jgi:MoaA/NifB/PqqE/SkfB family radical SAM enzyme